MFESDDGKDSLKVLKPVTDAQGNVIVEPMDIRKTVLAHHPELQNCYKAALAETPQINGKITMEWLIGENGQVKKTRVKDNSTESGKLAFCVTDAARNWIFPKPAKGDVHIIYPLIFNSGTQGAAPTSAPAP